MLRQFKVILASLEQLVIQTTALLLRRRSFHTCHILPFQFEKTMKIRRLKFKLRLKLNFED